MNVEEIVKNFLEKVSQSGDGIGYGARVKSGLPLINFVLDNMVGEVKIINQQAAMPAKGKPLVHITAHGSLLGPLPMMAALGRMYIDEGLGDEVLGFYTHLTISFIPGLNEAFVKMGAMTGVIGIESLVRLLESGRIRITGTALEGVNCLFTWKDQVAPFRTGGMIAAAIMSGASICLLAHEGTEPWSMEIKLPLERIFPQLGNITGLNIPIGPWKKIERLTICCKRYRPHVTRDAFMKMDAGLRRDAIYREMKIIRERLNKMMSELRRTS